MNHVDLQADDMVMVPSGKVQAVRLWYLTTYDRQHCSNVLRSDLQCCCGFGSIAVISALCCPTHFTALLLSVSLSLSRFPSLPLPTSATDKCRGKHIEPRICMTTPTVQHPEQWVLKLSVLLRSPVSVDGQGGILTKSKRGRASLGLKVR